jgi:Fur family transcriptional regulator, ferric uptake regulator
VADQPVIERFRAWLREQNLPATPQRMAVADLLLGSGRRLSAEELIGALAAKGAKIGTATVYRTIEMLVEGGFVEEHDRGEGFRRFEAKRGLPHLEQLLCSVCGRVEEFEEPALERMTKRVAETYAFVRERHRLVIYGQCSACRGTAAESPQAKSQVRA